MHEIFSFKNYAENEARRLVANLFLFFIKALYKITKVVRTLVLIYFDGPRLEHGIKTNVQHFRLTVHRYTLIFTKVWD